MGRGRARGRSQRGRPGLDSSASSGSPRATSRDEAATIMNKALIYDWNRDAPSAPPPLVMLDDETLRDGLQSPSVRAPSIDQKLRILRLLDQIGVDTADIGLPGAGPHVVRDVERLAREIVDSKLKIQANCAARTVVSDMQPIVDVSQRVGLPIECCCFIGSSPIRRYAEDWTVDYLQRCTEEAVSFGVNHGLEVMYVTEDTTRSDPETLRRLFTTAIRAGASRICIADTVGHATPAGARAVVTFAQTDRRRHGRGSRHRLARPSRSRHGHDQQPGGARSGRLARARDDPRHRRARRQHADGHAAREPRAHGMDHSATSPGSTTLVRAVSEATGEPIPDNYPVFGRDAFRTATGVHAAAVVKAFRKNDPELMDAVYSGVPAQMVGRAQQIDVGPLSGKSNVVFWLEQHGFVPGRRRRRPRVPPRQVVAAGAHRAGNPRRNPRRADVRVHQAGRVGKSQVPSPPNPKLQARDTELGSGSGHWALGLTWPRGIDIPHHTKGAGDGVNQHRESRGRRSPGRTVANALIS